MNDEPISAFLVKPHAPDCSAERNFRNGSWDTPWALPTGKVLWRGRDGTKRGSHVAFVVVRCNDINCKAEKAISHSALGKIGGF